MADKAVSPGLKLFYISTAPHQISKGCFTKINYCMKCYIIDHASKECPKPKGFKVCSECSSNDNTWTACTLKTKKYINCGEAQRTLAHKCSKRKERVKEKEKVGREKKKKDLLPGNKCSNNSRKLCKPYISIKCLRKQPDLESDDLRLPYSLNEHGLSRFCLC